MEPISSPQFSAFRSLIWPIHSSELKKVIPMLLIFFLVSFNYNMLRNMKDALIVTQEHSGAEVIPFIKVWGMLPMALMMTFVLTRLKSALSLERVFYIMVTVFLLYFVGFTFVLYPHANALSLNHLADTLTDWLPRGSMGLIAMIRYWLFSTFYVMAEMWSNIVLSVLFWGFANEITPVNQAKRFYGVLGLSANLSSIVSAEIALYFVHESHKPGPGMFGSSSWEQTFMPLMILVVIIGILTMLIYYILHRTVLNKEEAKKETHHGGSENHKISFRRAFSSLIRSKYVFSIAAIVISYNIIINLLEVFWKDQVRQLYPNATDYMAYMNHVTFWTGIVATVVGLLVTSNALRFLGWTKTALLTPLILLLTSIGVFGFFLYGNASLGFFLNLLNITSPLVMIVFFGSTQNVCSRAAKYTVFDATKELAFIPLNKVEKFQAKAAIDGFCSRLGKSGGSIIYQILLLFFTTISATAPYVGALVFVVLGVWIGFVKSLGKQFTALTSTTPPPSESTPTLNKEDIASKTVSKQAI